MFEHLQELVDEVKEVFSRRLSRVGVRLGCVRVVRDDPDADETELELDLDWTVGAPGCGGRVERATQAMVLSRTGVVSDVERREKLKEEAHLWANTLSARIALARRLATPGIVDPRPRAVYRRTS